LPFDGFHPNALGLFSPFTEDLRPGMVDLYDMGAGTHTTGFQRRTLKYGGEANMFDEMSLGVDEV
jgi:hypothetical protein